MDYCPWVKLPAFVATIHSKPDPGFAGQGSSVAGDYCKTENNDSALRWSMRPSRRREDKPLHILLIAIAVQ